LDQQQKRIASGATPSNPSSERSSLSTKARARFIPTVNHFFVANLALFWLFLTLQIDTALVARMFYVMGRRVQPVLGGGVLVVHGRPVHSRSRQAR
jgi:hypothetical protein